MRYSVEFVNMIIDNLQHQFGHLIVKICYYHVITIQLVLIKILAFYQKMYIRGYAQTSFHFRLFMEISVRANFEVH